MRPMCEMSSSLKSSCAESMAMSIESESWESAARVVHWAPKHPESQHENWMEPDFQFISGLWVQSQSMPSKRSQGMLTMPNVLSSEWSPILRLRETTWVIEPLDRGLPSNPWMGIAGLRGMDASRCFQTKSSDISEDCEPLSIIVCAWNGFPFRVCTVALQSKCSATNDLMTAQPSVICKFSLNAPLTWDTPQAIAPDVWPSTSEERLFPSPQAHQKEQ